MTEIAGDEVTSIGTTHLISAAAPGAPLWRPAAPATGGQRGRPRAGSIMPRRVARRQGAAASGGNKRGPGARVRVVGPARRC